MSFRDAIPPDGVTFPGVTPKLFVWENIQSYRSTPFSAQLPPDTRTFWVPRDGAGVHQLLVDLAYSTKRICAIDMYGYDDPDIDKELKRIAAAPSIAFQMSLDASQDNAPTESKLLADGWPEGCWGNAVAYGTAIDGGYINHDKIAVFDSYLVTGSTNWSYGGETNQNNQLTITNNDAQVAEALAIMMLNHQAMQAQMRARGELGPPGSKPS